MGAFSTSNYSFMKLQLLALFFYQLPVCAVKYEQACISAEMSIEQHSFFGVCAGHVRDHQSAVWLLLESPTTITTGNTQDVKPLFFSTSSPVAHVHKYTQWGICLHRCKIILLQHMPALQAACSVETQPWHTTQPALVYFRKLMCGLRECLLFKSVYLDHLSHVALRACVLGRIFDFHQHDEEEVMPHVVLLFNVLLKRHRLVVKFVPLQACKGGQ